MKGFIGSVLLSQAFYICYISQGLCFEFLSLAGFFFCGLVGVTGVILLIEHNIEQHLNKE